MRVTGEDLVGALAGQHDLVTCVANGPAQEVFRHAVGVEAKRLGMPCRIGEAVCEVGLPYRDRVELGAGVRRHLAGDGPLVVAGPVERQRERPDRIATVLCRQTQHSTGVDPAAEITADWHVGPKPQSDCFIEDVTEPLGILGVGANRPVIVGRRVVEIPVADQADVPAGGEQEVPGRHLVNAIKESEILVGHKEVVGLEERGAIPAGGNAQSEQRLDFRGQVQHASVIRIVEGLDAKAIAGGEERVVRTVPERERELTAQLVQASRAEVFIKVQCDLTVGARAKAVATTFEVALDTLEIVELTVDDDPHALVLAGDRLLAGGQVDDAEPGMSHPNPPIGSDPRSLAVGTAMGEPRGRLLQDSGRNRRTGGAYCHDPAHSGPSFFPSDGANLNWATAFLGSCGITILTAHHADADDRQNGDSELVQYKQPTPGYVPALFAGSSGRRSTESCRAIGARPV